MQQQRMLFPSASQHAMVEKGLVKQMIKWCNVSAKMRCAPEQASCGVFHADRDVTTDALCDDPTRKTI